MLKRKNKINLLSHAIISLMLTPLLLASCNRGIGSPTRLNDAPAPTTLPLVETAELPGEVGPVKPEQPIALPPGFEIAVYAQGLKGPRMMTIGPDGSLYVAERGADRVIRLPDRDGDGQADDIEIVADKLDAPSSLTFYKDDSLYVAETTRVLRLSEADASGVYQRRQILIADLPGGGHNTRTLLFNADYSALFVSVGSSCNVCREADERRAAILRYNPDGSGETIYAQGLRNAVGIVFRPGTQEIWATNNGRDMLGDDLPPETVNIVLQGDEFGWPRCHAGRIPDPEFGKDDGCTDVKAPVVEMQAHSAPLGLAFYTGTQFPKIYHGGLFVAFHGSWNRSEPTGYKVVFIPVDAQGKAGAVQDFAAGWLKPDGSRWGRPVDLVNGQYGSLFLSDDSGGVIYRIFYPAQ